MAKFNYATSAYTALNLIARFGQSVLISSEYGGSYDPITGSVTPATTSSQNSIGIIKDYGIKDISAGIVLAGDKELTIGASDISKPNVTDTVVVGGIDYAIVPPVIEVSPAGIPIIYKLQLRGG